VVYELENLAKADGHHLNVLQMTIVEAAKRLHLDESDFSLRTDKNKRVALVHQAYGYLVEHFPTEHEWKSRLDMERSTAIMSPNIRFHLTSSKKIQQVLSQPGVLERFIAKCVVGSPEVSQKIRQTYMGFWGLDSSSKETLAVIQAAIKEPGKFVLKSQLEAGKGNFFDEEITQMLQTLSTEEKGAYILMEKIIPLITKNYMVRPFSPPKLEDIHSEVSMYGSLMANPHTGEVLFNKWDGHLVRTKPASANQGGISAGSGVIDSVLLFPNEKFTPTH
jgi:glutathione synthase